MSIYSQQESSDTPKQFYARNISEIYVASGDANKLEYKIPMSVL